MLWLNVKMMTSQQNNQIKDPSGLYVIIYVVNTCYKTIYICKLFIGQNKVLYFLFISLLLFQFSSFVMLFCFYLKHFKLKNKFKKHDQVENEVQDHYLASF